MYDERGSGFRGADSLCGREAKRYVNLDSFLIENARGLPRVEEIRQAMLESLGDSGALAYPLLERRITFEHDAQGLWYLRGDLMEALAAMQGEAQARKEIDELTVMFQGLLPRALSSRPSPLSE